jgi:hypothetical protein
MLFEATRTVYPNGSSGSGQGFPEKVTAFRDGMAVHDRYRQPCFVCDSPIDRIVYSENEANYCTTCQTGDKLLADRALSRLLKKDWPRSLDEMADLRNRQRKDSSSTTDMPKLDQPTHPPISIQALAHFLCTSPSPDRCIQNPPFR